MRDSAFFFYGTLMDRDLLSVVLGRQVWPRLLAPAVLRGYRRRSVHGANYSVAMRQRGASVEGVILNRVGNGESTRLSAYEGDGYQLVPALVELSCRRLRRVFLFKPNLALTSSRSDRGP